MRVNLGLDSAERSNGLKAARGQISPFAGQLGKVAAGLVAAAVPAMTAKHAGAARQILRAAQARQKRQGAARGQGGDPTSRVMPQGVSVRPIY
ncbi:hypothetical protein [Phaeovulum sp. W22_SRMD_FR3]|uniref:hypothetical protein n=1 Tax=Phaeovulum sp. W22_SRMD_FR3 TaxID=3240274 RepID=UPI003F959092